MNTQSKSAKYKSFRLAAMLIEAIPLGLILMGLLMDINELKIIGFMTTAMMYMSASFYLFKAEKFKTVDVLLAVFSGILISVILVGFLFEILRWPSGPEMLLIGKLSLNFGLIVSGAVMIFRYFKSENRAFEFTMSQKLFSRFLLLLFIYYATGLNESVGSIPGIS